MTDPSPQTSNCLCCGGNDFAWGKPQANYDVSFKSDDANWLVRHTVFGGESLRARLCNDCGNVQLFLPQH